MKQIALLIHKVLTNPEGKETVLQVSRKVEEISAGFPLTQWDKYFTMGESLL